MRETSLEDFVDEAEGSTYAWTPGGRACPACGSVVERRWRDGDELVCVDCVSW
ncbi:DUF7573 domain-containing protein [Natronomonas sp.]|uniref:DUF7573 domain-containing protein n=1 Tax=Natronomonas sp. TaxID=2184060 RepID=UPI00261C4C73|nr:hypothetical protein [Natronomonas sp.]